MGHPIQNWFPDEERKKVKIEHDIRIREVKENDGTGFIVFIIICIILGFLFSG